MNNTTHSVKANEIEKKWYILDATDRPLGRVATEAARLLRGKHKPTYSTHIDCGDNVIVINADKAVLKFHGSARTLFLLMREFCPYFLRRYIRVRFRHQEQRFVHA